MRLTPDCEPALLERFLKAEAMALWAVRSAQLQAVPANVQVFLRQHEEDERDHLRQFETLLGHRSHERERLPAVPRQWPALAVQLYGYEALGLEFAHLLATVRPDLASILADEETHVDFFEREVRKLLTGGGGPAEQARLSARAWWRKLPGTVDRYLDGDSLRPFKDRLAADMLAAIGRRFAGAGLLEADQRRIAAGLSPPS
ncbi:hypothetical protein NITMOv2_2040 [Nitrospira moscoviensis]|uniref:Ferritin-like domain-containing protein n=2 Tax=Nitrospira moscoviensis TaxID=42253 RepID=A0A0K2GCZ3_NITMO|nr:hypothetical protein NITMOv2_2040 [Nitrospira moscoviensis]